MMAMDLAVLERLERAIANLSERGRQRSGPHPDETNELTQAE